MPFNRPIVDQMIQDVGGAAFCRLAKLFIEETAGELDAIDRLAASLQDMRELGRRAHSLKNAAASFGLADLAAAARDLEAASDAANSQTAQKAATGLRAICAAGMPELSRLIDETAALGGSQP